MNPPIILHQEETCSLELPIAIDEEKGFYKKRYVAAIALSILLHGILLGVIAYSRWKTSGLANAGDRIITIDLVATLQQHPQQQVCSAMPSSGAPTVSQVQRPAASLPHKKISKPKKNSALPVRTAQAGESRDAAASAAPVGGKASASTNRRAGSQPGIGGNAYAPPRCLVNAPPLYPLLARRKGYEGAVMVEAFVGCSGQTNNLRVYKSSGYAVLDEAAITSVKGWLFEPGVENGKKTDMIVRIPVLFKLN
ncbi:MAG: energy transducer TonB [Pseudomonadota bacterium]